MKPAWDKLAKKFAKGNVVVGDVDCTVHQGLCSQNGVQGYPTVKYYQGGSWKDYQGGRDYNSLEGHVTGTMGGKNIPCTIKQSSATGSFGDPEGCSKKEITFINKMKAKDKEGPKGLDNAKKVLKACIREKKGENCRKAAGTKVKLSSRKMEWVKTKLKIVEAIVPMNAAQKKTWTEMKENESNYKDLQALLGKALKGDGAAITKVNAAVNWEKFNGMKQEL